MQKFKTTTFIILSNKFFIILEKPCSFLKSCPKINTKNKEAQIILVNLSQPNYGCVYNYLTLILLTSIFTALLPKATKKLFQKKKANVFSDLSGAALFVRKIKYIVRMSQQTNTNRMFFYTRIKYKHET